MDFRKVTPASIQYMGRTSPRNRSTLSRACKEHVLNVPPYDHKSEAVRETPRHHFVQNPSVPEDQSLRTVRVVSDEWIGNVVAYYGPHKKAQSHLAGDGESSLRDQIRNEEIRRGTRVTDIAAELSLRAESQS
ncbi:jg1751 [Pararge aegeria aegeria]|uniref:Jg1751 protein n=1 Tax=Pararge aegeria aegeria TaxID=348720 RepID=A0A8S4SPD2_9NEOP|nr:jg1751 [Pararge aegeria aegeria]